MCGELYVFSRIPGHQVKQYEATVKELARDRGGGERSDHDRVRAERDPSALDKLVSVS